jgi:hypothetical protein
MASRAIRTAPDAREAVIATVEYRGFNFAGEVRYLVIQA